MPDTETHDPVLTLVAQITSAHVANNQTNPEQIPALIHQIYQALKGLGKEAEPVVERPQPAVPVRRSVQNDHIVCLEDGAKLKMLKRYLQTRYNMSPDQYRERWGLPADYPMVAPDYAERRSTLAKSIGLGRKRIVPAPAAAAPQKRGRKPRIAEAH